LYTPVRLGDSRVSGPQAEEEAEEERRAGAAARSGSAVEAAAAAAAASAEREDAGEEKRKEADRWREAVMHERMRMREARPLRAIVAPCVRGEEC
jgi:hypothetical protein